MSTDSHVKKLYVVATTLTGFGVDENLVRADAAGTHSLLTDALGSTLAMTMVV